MEGPPFVTAREAALLARGVTGRVFFAGSAALPTAILDAVSREPELWQDLTLTGPFIPGVNDADYSALGTRTTVEAIFATPGLMVPQGACRLLAIHYSAYWRRLSAPGHVSLAYVTVPPPRADGSIGLGLAADFVPAVIAAGAQLVGVVNAAMPDVGDGPRYPADRFAALVEGDAPLPTYDPGGRMLPPRGSQSVWSVCSDPVILCSLASARCSARCWRRWAKAVCVGFRCGRA